MSLKGFKLSIRKAKFGTERDSKTQFYTYYNILETLFFRKIDLFDLEKYLKESFNISCKVRHNQNQITFKMKFGSKLRRLIVSKTEKLVIITDHGKGYEKYLNPDPMQRALELFEDFNHYEAQTLSNLDLPISKDTVLVKLGHIENLEYISDKKIFASDKKTRKRKKRTYIHNFTEYNKEPLLLSNEKGNILIIFDPSNEIEVKKSGII